MPAVASAPLHAPLAAQAVALVLDHVNLAGLPAATLLGLTEMLTVGAGAGATETLNPIVALAAASVLLPVKVTVRVATPACDGVNEQVAVPR